MCSSSHFYSFSVCTSTILILYTHLCVLWSLKCDLGVSHNFYRLLFGGKELPPLENSGLKLTPSPRANVKTSDLN